MLNYIEYLISEYRNLPFRMINARTILLPNADAAKFIINLILDTELSGYVVDIQDHKLVKSEISDTLDVVELDTVIPAFKDIVKAPELRRIMDTHFNPIWRVAAFFCGFILKAHEVYVNEHQ